VQGGEEVLLVDPKFSPASKRLRAWISRSIGAEVKMVVNTHYHYDHTQGNVLYPGARIIAHETCDAFVRQRLQQQRVLEEESAQSTRRDARR
jgi:glyoxylase-like metal-dependent hydrolase (beta-lactamase superfamily II)